VLGVSPDTVADQAKFRDKYRLNFPLLSDPDHKVAERYGCWREQNRYGKTTLGIQRATWIIGPDGVVRKVWKRVNVDGHHAEVLAALKAL
jgi:peroxiredoxin Q/BCP